ncbi:MAG: hypothetical protein J0I12_07785 [Candidatus Eremiobacteraeota bacterium]|nr:hypothetical protein [Candidatus Eremiobacteraeota bacterium]
MALALASCARREPMRQETAPPKVPREIPKSKPLKVEPLPKRSEPSWTSPAPLSQPNVPESHSLELEKPGLDMPMLPRPPAWSGPYWDKRFDEWHFADLKKQSLPRLDWKLDLEIARAPSHKDVFQKVYVPVNNINSVLDQIEREQRQHKEDYPDFPIPLNLQIPY